ncbi:BlaI/MecI/CopY family transcriptional regulator [Massilia sp. PWRC2]|uniref:BlaI/MecI/CopY family transcriptional regulator n=1 Tax=Massilia sp. PWRC2 TaxID=2804626 RepID=UPI003CEFE0EC
MDTLFTDRQADLMQVLWDRGPCRVAQVQQLLDDRLAYNAVPTALRTLEARHDAGDQAVGRGHHDHALIEPQQARMSALRHLTDKLFKGSTGLLMTDLVSGQARSAAQAERLCALLDQPDKAAAADSVQQQYQQPPPKAQP